MKKRGRMNPFIGKPYIGPATANKCLIEAEGLIRHVGAYRNGAPATYVISLYAGGTAQATAAQVQEHLGALDALDSEA